MLYNNILHLCADNKITIAQLEKRCGFANATIRRWESGSPSIANVEKVADFFKVGLDYLTGRDVYDLSDEAQEIANRFDALTPEKRRLAAAYLGIVEAQ